LCRETTDLQSCPERNQAQVHHGFPFPEKEKGFEECAPSLSNHDQSMQEQKTSLEKILFDAADKTILTISHRANILR
jgi:hypothetical protein